jgi:hypothetical protein
LIDVLCPLRGETRSAFRPATTQTPIPSITLGVDATEAFLDISLISAGVQTLFGTNTNHAVPGRGQTCTLGEILLSAGPVAVGIPANGQRLPISQNFPLFTLLGTMYGGDDQNFALPDLRAAAPNGLTYSICDQGIFPTER